MKKQINKMVEKYLKKKKEKVVLELNVSNYNKNNFYIALVYSEKVDLYKILYIPFDMVLDNDIEEYVCYQFVDLLTVEYILKCLTKVKDYNGKMDFSNKTGMYNIEINMYLLNDYYQFKATQFIPRSWIFLFDVIVTLFEFVPHIVSGICEDMLLLFKDSSEEIPYQEMFEFDLMRDDSEELLKIFDGKLLSFNKISYLEEVNGKYFAIISGHIVIINYNKCGVICTYCDCDNYGDFVYTVIEAIRNEIVKKFSKIVLTNKETPNLVQYYLCYSVSKKGLKVIHGYSEKVLSRELYNDGLIKFVEDLENLEDKLK